MDQIRKTGSERFLLGDVAGGFDLLGFWQWAASDLAGNTLRGWLAEYIVALDLGVADGTRVQWEAFDLKTTDGIKVEVKSAAYLQSWEQTRPSKIEFDISATNAWDDKLNSRSTEKKRQADVYVFALLKHQEKETLNPLNLGQWEFYVLPTEVLNRVVPNQKKIGLNSLRRLKPQQTHFGGIAKAIAAAAV